MALEKNKLKNNEQLNLNQLSSIKNNIYKTTIKHHYNNLFDNENNCSLNDYLNLYNNNNNYINLDNNISNDDLPVTNSNIQDNNKLNITQNSPDAINKRLVHVETINNNLNESFEAITEEKRKEYKNKIILNEELFNTYIKKKYQK